MNRRHFLELLGAGLVGTAVDVDRVLWTPGQRTHLLPPPAGWKQHEVLVLPEGCLVKGDIIEIDSVYAVNPQTGRPLPFLQQFILTENVTSPTVPVMALHPRPNAHAFSRTLRKAWPARQGNTRQTDGGMHVLMGLGKQ